MKGKESLKITKEGIIQFLEQTEQGPITLRRLFSALRVDGKSRQEVKQLLRELIESGQMIRIKGGKYGISRKMNLVPGHIKAHPSGYGFVIPDDESQADIFIPPEGMREALDGDRVMARSERIDRTGRRSGSIVRILERAHKTLIGRFEKTKHTCFVVPNDPSLIQDILIPKDNKGLKPKKGQLVVVEILEYPTRYRNPTGRITEVLGWPDDPGIDVEVVIRDSQLPDAFPENVQKEAKAFSPQLTEQDLEGRIDLRDLLTITIDGETARDFDDAISWQSLSDESKGLKESKKSEESEEREELKKAKGLKELKGAKGANRAEGTQGRERLWVHIADVSHYVPEGSALDEEAFSRGTSVYFPERAIPMLPQELSNELCSLKPRVDRLTVSVRMDFDAGGNLLDYEIVPSVINSNERMTYTQVRDILSREAQTPQEFHYLEPTIKAMGDLTVRLRRNRMKAGSLDFDLPEPEVILNLRGDVQSIIRAERNLAHILIEEFMLVANLAVAGHMSRLKIPFIYRIHEEPEEADVIGFMEFIHELGWEEGEDEGEGEREGDKEGEGAGEGEKLYPLYAGHSRRGKREILKPEKKRRKKLRESVKTKLEHADLQKILNRFRGKPEEAVINYLLLRTMKRARYSIQNAGHFGLAMKEYTHFTSPIRRYPDLVVHRLLKQVLAKRTETLLNDQSLPERLSTIANHSSLRERVAEDAERRIVALKRVRYMQEKIGEEYTGIISTVTAFGFFVELDEIFVEGLIHIRNLADDYYQFDERKHRLEGIRTGNTFHIGDRVKVRVSHIDLSRVHIDFTLVAKLS
ncbi:MAG: RNB domain-containing ribonuclease [bacterium]